MPNFERGVYEPSNEVRVFDGSEEDEDMEGSRLPLLIVLALLVLAMFGGLVWFAYASGVARGRTETPVLAAAAGPARVAPQNPGGADAAYKGFKIYEQPAPPDEDSDAAAPPPAAKTPVPPVTPPPVQQVAQAAPAPVASPPVPAKPAPAPAAAKPAALPKAETLAPAPVLKKTAAPLPAPSSVGPATGAPRQLGAIAPKPAPASTPVVARPLPVAAPKPAAGGAFVLQIGAYKSQADADAAWKVYKAKHAALLSGYASDVQQADLGEKGIWYRLRVAGFSDRDVASGVCDRLKADGGACILGK